VIPAMFGDPPELRLQTGVMTATILSWTLEANPALATIRFSPGPW
jgi:hypothetical protein